MDYVRVKSLVGAGRTKQKQQSPSSDEPAIPGNQASPHVDSENGKRLPPHDYTSNGPAQLFLGRDPNCDIGSSDACRRIR
jgi:hypothetical protein